MKIIKTKVYFQCRRKNILICVILRAKKIDSVILDFILKKRKFLCNGGKSVLDRKFSLMFNTKIVTLQKQKMENYDTLHFIKDKNL